MKRSVNQLKRAILYLVVLVIFSQCSTNEPIQDLSDRLNEVYNIARTHSINRFNIDWEALRVEMAELESQANFESALRHLLRSLADNHSFYTYSGGGFVSESQIRCDGNAFTFSSMPQGVGYIQVNGFTGSSSQALERANAIQQSIREQDVEGLKGWVIDLSNNGGGNMYPMIAGLGPFYREEVLGHFIGPNQTETEWGYSGGGSFVSDFTNKVVQVDEPYELKNPGLKVAVIVSNRTASSGEASLISFIGRESTLILGRPSCGLSTANSSFNLSNGDRLVLTVSTMADRNGELFGEQIMPDELINSDQELIDRLNQWFNE